MPGMWPAFSTDWFSLLQLFCKDWVLHWIGATRCDDFYRKSVRGGTLAGRPGRPWAGRRQLVLYRMPLIIQVANPGPEEGNPETIRHSQPRISRYFTCGRSVIETMQELQSGRISVHDIPPIKVFQRFGLLWSHDNRRLWAFRTAPCERVPIVRMRAKKADPRRQPKTPDQGMDIVFNWEVKWPRLRQKNGFYPFLRAKDCRVMKIAVACSDFVRGG